MRARRTPSTDRVFRLPGGTEDNDLWAQRTQEGGKPIIRSVWQPNDEEREALALGANVELLVWGTVQPRVAVGVTAEQAGRAAR